MAWMKSWGAGGGAGEIDEDLGKGKRREEVLVARMKNWGAGGGAVGVDKDVGGGRRC